MRIQLLGQPGILNDDGTRVGLKYAKSRALIFMLAAEQEPVDVRVLQTRLWGATDDPSGLDGKWSAVVRDVDQALPGALAVDGESVLLNEPWRHASDWSDVLAWVRQRTQQPDTAPPNVTWGAFLDGFDAIDTPEFSAWQTGFDERVRNLITDALDAHAQRQTANGDDASALTTLQAALHLSPWAEPLHQKAIESLGRLGRVGDAQAQFEACNDALQARFGHGPSKRTRDALKALAENSDRPDNDVARRTAIPEPVLPPIGREPLVQRVLRAFENDAARALHLVGPPGVGTTTVAAEAARTAQLSGHSVRWTEWRYASDELAGWNASRTRLSGFESPLATTDEALRDVASSLEQDGVDLLVLNDVPPSLDISSSIRTLLEAAPTLNVWWVGGRRSRHAAIALIEVGTLEVPDMSEHGVRFDSAPAVALLRSLAERRGLPQEAVPEMLIRRLMQRTLGHTESLTVTGLNIDRVMALSRGGFEGASLDALGDAFFERGAVWIRRGGVDSTNQHIDAAGGDAATLLEAAATFEGWLHLNDAAALAGLAEEAWTDAARELVDLGLLLQDPLATVGHRYGVVPSVRYELRRRLSDKERERMDDRLAKRLAKQSATLDAALRSPAAQETQAYWSSYDLDVLGAIRRFASRDVGAALGLAANTWRWFSRAGQAQPLTKRLEAMLASRKAATSSRMPEAEAALGALLLRTGRLSESLKRLEKADRLLDKQSPVWILNRLDLAWALGRLDRASDGLKLLEERNHGHEPSESQADWLAGRHAWVEGVLEEGLGTQDSAWASYGDAARRFEASSLADGVQLARLSQALLATTQNERAQAAWATRLLLESLDAAGLADPQELASGLVRLAHGLEGFEPGLADRLHACLATCPPVGMAFPAQGGDPPLTNDPLTQERTVL